VTPVVLDADALHCLRSYGLSTELEKHVATAAVEAAPLICTSFVAHHELNPLAKEVEQWTSLGLLEIKDVPSRSLASEFRRELRRRHRGIDKGEAEIISWIVTSSRGTPFVSCDVRAREIARAEKILAWDVLDAIHEWLACKMLHHDAAQRCVAPWSDDPHARWRPRDFDGLEATLRKRYGNAYLSPLERR
jgi:hypothetical protein